jgi:hypothetical protein
LRAISPQPTGWSWRVAHNGWLGVVAYGISDVFVPARTPEAWGVFYDAIGGGAGLLALWTLGRLWKWW